MSNEELEKDDPLAELFADAVEVSLKEMLPSKGKTYPGHDGMVSVRALAFEDERKLSKIHPSDFINTVLSLCVDPIDAESLLSVDKLFLLYKVRETSFGSKIKMTTSCISCKNKTTLEIDLGSLPIDYVDDTFDGTLSGNLPILKRDFVIRVPNSSEHNLYKGDMLSNLWRFIVRIGNVEDKKLINQALKRLKVADIRTLQHNMGLDDFGIQTKAMFICGKCGEENMSNIPITEGFFTVN